MMLKTAFVLAVVALTPAVAMASPSCTTEPQAKWMSEDAMKAKVG